MKPIKPKKMSKAAESSLSLGADTVGLVLTARQCRDVLAALEYERQRADEAEKDQATESEAKLKAWKQVAELKAEIERIRPSHWHD